MPTAVVREESGSFLVEVPQDAIEQLHLEGGTEMDVAVEEEKIVLSPRRRRYSLDQLLSEHAEIADQLPDNRE